MMNRSLFAAAALAAAFAVGAAAQTSRPPSAPAPASAAAAPTGATKVAVIAFQPAVVSTNEGRASIAKLQQKFAPKQAELKAMDDQINTLKKALQADGATLSAAERATRQRTIDDKQKTLQRDVQGAQSDYQQALGEAFQGLAQKFGAVLQDYAKANGYGVVLDVSSQQTPVLWASKGADISEAVIAEYNQKSGVAAPPAASAPTHSGTTTTHRHTTTAAH
ncbi:MAG: OmpH/Skp family outer membrane protein [Acidobacteriaceae bacterium]